MTAGHDSDRRHQPHPDGGAVVTLDDSDRAMLRDCPFTIYPDKRPNKAAQSRMVRVKRLWSAGLIGGEVQAAKGQPGNILKIFIRNAGREAIGRPPLPGDV